MSRTRWILPPENSTAAESISRELGISTTVASLLTQRIPSCNVKSASEFLSPSLGNLLSPWLLPNMEKGANRLADAVKNRERIVIYGDYDADGVTSTALMLRVLAALGCDAEHYLPCRVEEGYGISEQFVEQAIIDRVQLVVTVDCGITEQEHIARLTENGIDVIVTDHHEPGDEDLPHTCAIIDPKTADSEYPFRELTGVGVAFKLAWATCEKIVGSPKVGEKLQRTLINLLPLVAIGTIADVAPLIGENRILVAFGLRTFRDTYEGIKALAKISSVKSEIPSTRDVAFGIAPRINAAGRMGDAELALQVLMSNTKGEAETLSARLDVENINRQKLGQKIKTEALSMVAGMEPAERESIIVVASEGWYEGVIGIAASRVGEIYNLPAIIISINGELAKGSGRSIEGFNLHGAVAKSRKRFLTFGGHEQAVGFTIPTDQINAFRAELIEESGRRIKRISTIPKTTIDKELHFSDISERLFDEIKLLAPFGNGNEKPKFIARDIAVLGKPKLMGRDNNHFSFNACQNGTAYRAVVFNNTSWLEKIDAGIRQWDVVFSLQLNDFRRPAQLELIIDDMRPTENE